MVAVPDTTEYLAEIRKRVCSRCVERPPGGPPCLPLGKNCGVELHLPQLIDSIHEVRSSLLQPYLEHNRHNICEKCAFLGSSICPCPMDYLAVLIVDAVESVDARHEEMTRLRLVQPAVDPSHEVEAIEEAYRESAGAWGGCDWPTRFGKTALNLDGCTAAHAQAMAGRFHGTEEGKDWEAATTWLAQVERHAAEAEVAAALAVEAARAGRWREAREHADRAWALEFATGRPIWHQYPLAWQRLRQRIEAVWLAQQDQEA
jgi:hypothetical protein